MAEDQVDLDEIDTVYYKVLRKLFFQFFREDDEGSVGRKILKIILLTVAFSALLIYFMLQALFWNNVEDFSQKMINLAILVNVFSIICRLIVICAFPEQMESTFLNFETFHCNQHRPSYTDIVLNKAYKQTLKVDFWATIFFFTLPFCWFILPLISNKVTFNLLTGHNVTYEEWLANMPTSIFFEIQTPWKEIRYVLEVFEAIIGSAVWLTSDVIYFAIINMLRTQLTLLGESIVRNNKVANIDKTEPMSYKYFVQDHIKLVRACKTLEEILSPILGTQLMTTLVLLAGILLSVTSGPENEMADMGDYAAFYIRFVIYMANALLELYLFCWLSDITNTAYVDIGKAVYYSEWYLKLDAKARHSMLSIQIAQKGINITAFKMIKIDLSTFIEVLRVSYSYFTVMQQGIKNDDKMTM